MKQRSPRSAIRLFLALAALTMSIPSAPAQRPVSNPATDAGESSKDDAQSLSKQTLLGKQAGQEATNTIGQLFCWCPPGHLTMGSPPTEAERSYDEKQVEVTLTHGFWMSKFEVSEREFRTVTRRSPRNSLGDSYPVSDTKSGDARRFAEMLTKAEHENGHLPADWTYSLPTEAEWEYACRAGTRAAYSFGNDVRQLSFHGNFADRNLLAFNNSEYRYASKSLDDGYARAAPVGSYPANPWGLCDMHGNVWEWCADAYQDQLPGGRDPVGPPKGTDRGKVIRGGSWLSHSHYCRSAMRQAHHDLNSAPYIGIRIVLRKKRTGDN